MLTRSGTSVAAARPGASRWGASYLMQLEVSSGASCAVPHTQYLEPTSVIRRQAKFSKNTVPAPTVAFHTFLILLIRGRRKEPLEENSAGEKKKTKCYKVQ